MSIVESTKTKTVRRIPRLEGIAGGVLIAAAVFAATPKLAHAEIDYTGTGGTTTDPNSANAASWFNIANWNNGVTGTLAESNLTGAAQNIIANNASMPSVGVIFDPAHDVNTPGGPSASYVANLQNVQGSFYIASSPSTVSSPNKLTVDSGTIIVGTATVGRDNPGILALNGGTFIVAGGTLKVQGSNRTTLLGSGTFEYHGGTLETLQGVQLGSGASTVGVAKTSAGVAYFTIYNDGPDGAMLSQNGFQFAANTNQMGTIGIVEFHYDNNTGGIGGTRPFQNNWNQGNGETGQGILHITNNTNSSARLNLVLDAAPSLFPTSDPLVSNIQNLGLFDETVIAGSGTYPKAFYSVDGSTVFTQGATITASFSGKQYSWTISYSGQINFTNTATSAYDESTGISGTGGNDVVLIGLQEVATTPEPASLALLGGTGALIMSRRRTKKKDNQTSGA
jgi:hypothetical protein